MMPHPCIPSGSIVSMEYSTPVDGGVLAATYNIYCSNGNAPEGCEYVLTSIIKRIDGPNLTEVYNNTLGLSVACGSTSLGLEDTTFNVDAYGPGLYMWVLTGYQGTPENIGAYMFTNVYEFTIE
jgi:hypothetical protein